MLAKALAAQVAIRRKRPEKRVVKPKKESPGLWLVFCRRANAIDLATLRKHFGQLPQHTSQLAAKRLDFTVEHAGAHRLGRVSVTTVSGAAARAEAAAVAKLDGMIPEGVPMPDLGALRKADFCYRLTYPREDAGIVYNTLFVLATELTSRCEAIAFDRIDQRYI
jgi:hypothetical protein